MKIGGLESGWTYTVGVLVIDVPHKRRKGYTETRIISGRGETSNTSEKAFVVD